MSRTVIPVAGAANYYHTFCLGKPVVVMIPVNEQGELDNNGITVIDQYKTIEKAVASADRWQKKENKAVTKNKV